MNYAKLREQILKPWANIKDIQLITGCGRDEATKIRNEISNNITKKGFRLPNGKTKVVPTKYVVEDCGLDENYIFQMANQIEKN